MVVSTVSRSSVEFTAWLTSPSACSSPTDCASSSVRARSSLSRRAFSMAMTAWAAKFLTSSICLSVNGANLLAVNDNYADQLVVLEHRNIEHSSEATEFDGCRPKSGWPSTYIWVGPDVDDMNGCLVSTVRPSAVRTWSNSGPRCQNSVKCVRYAIASQPHDRHLLGTKQRCRSWPRKCEPLCPARPEHWLQLAGRT